MGLNPKAASRKHDPWATEAMNGELFVLLVKLAGVLMLLLVEVVIVLSVRLHPDTEDAMNEIEDAVDALQQYQEMTQRRAGSVGYTSVWAPTMTEQQRREHEQYVKDNDLPF